tara:strand:- start:3297 stop:3683 length:387 start_codon:yes stop_codon:yes gene_type:complete
LDKVLIGSFLRENTRAPIVWGKTDCAMLAGKVWQMATGYDPMADLHGAYARRWEYLRLSMAEGGLRAMAKRRMDHPSAKPFAGDGIGLITHKNRQLFAVAAGGVWVSPGEQGGLMNVSDGRVLEAWGW